MTTTEYAVRGKNTGRIYLEFISYSRKEVADAVSRDHRPEQFEIIEREVGDWEVSPLVLGHYYKSNGELVINFPNGPIALAPDVQALLKEIL